MPPFFYSIVGVYHISSHTKKIQSLYFTHLFIHEVDYSIRFLTERGDNVWWFDGERISFRRNSTSIILKLMMEKPDITIVELAKQVSINISAVNKQIKQLQEKGFVERSVKNGFWHLILTPSL